MKIIGIDAIDSNKKLKIKKITIWPKRSNFEIPINSRKFKIYGGAKPPKYALISNKLVSGFLQILLVNCPCNCPGFLRGNNCPVAFQFPQIKGGRINPRSEF